MCRYGLVVGCAWCGDGNLNCWCDGNIETIRSKYQIMRRPLSAPAEPSLHPHCRHLNTSSPPLLVAAGRSVQHGLGHVLTRHYNLQSSSMTIYMETTQKVTIIVIKK